MIDFEPLKAEHFSYLLKWLQNPVVKKWYDSEIEYTSLLIEQKYLSYTKGYKVDEQGDHKKIAAFIILHGNNPIGYIQLYNAYDFGHEPPLTGLPKSLGAIDLFIGEDAFLGRGLGSEILQQFISLHGAHYDYLFVAPSSENLRAIKCYRNASFYPVGQGAYQWLLRSFDPVLQDLCQELISSYAP